MELRCEKKGHLLARVYPTTFGPLLVPAMSGPPPNSENNSRYGGERYEREKAFRAKERSLPEQFRTRYRDRWILRFRQDDSDRTEFMIRGLTLLTKRHRQTVLHHDGQPGTPAIDLACRCGTSWFGTAEVMTALDSNLGVLRPKLFGQVV
jgi:hypothetical protein